MYRFVLDARASTVSDSYKRHRGDSNPCGQSPMDFESISLATRTQCHVHFHLQSSLFASKSKFCWRILLSKFGGQESITTLFLSAQTSGDFYVAARFGHTRSHDLHARRTHDWTAPTKEATENIQARVAQWQSVGLVNRRFKVRSPALAFESEARCKSHFWTALLLPIFSTFSRTYSEKVCPHQESILGCRGYNATS